MWFSRVCNVGTRSIKCLQVRFKQRPADSIRVLIKQEEEEEKRGRIEKSLRNAAAGPDPIFVPRNLVEISWSKSQGSGGQNVNKVNTKAEIRFNIYECEWMPNDVLLKFQQLNQNRISNDGDFILTSSLTRSAHKNLEDCFGKLEHFVRIAQMESIPVEREDLDEVETPESQKVYRIREKKDQSKKKNMRKVGKSDYDY